MEAGRVSRKGLNAGLMDVNIRAGGARLAYPRSGLHYFWQNSASGCRCVLDNVLYKALTPMLLYDRPTCAGSVEGATCSSRAQAVHACRHQCALQQKCMHARMGGLSIHACLIPLALPGHAADVKNACLADKRMLHGSGPPTCF